MATQGPLYPGTAASLANAGTSENSDAWVNPGNIGSDNGTEATITAATYDSPDISQLLVASNFGFTIPTGATIDGITVEIDRRNSAGAASDNRVQLATGTTFADLVGTNKAATTTDWPTTTAVATYGGAADTWSSGLTVAQLNAAGFAVFLSVQADAANTDIQVDYIRVTVTYTPAADTALAGASTAISGASGVLTTAISLAGSAIAAATAAAVLTTSIALSGNAPGTATADANLSTSITLAGSTAGLSGASSSLTTAIPLAGSVTATSGASAAFPVDTALAGTTAAVSNASGSLTTAIPLVGDAAGASGADGLLSTQINLAGIVAATSGAVADLSVGNPLAGTVNATSGVAGTLTTSIALAGSSAGTSTVQAAWPPSSQAIGGHPPSVTARRARLTVLPVMVQPDVRPVHARPEIT